MKTTPVAVKKWFEGKSHKKPTQAQLRKVANGNYFYSQEARNALLTTRTSGPLLLTRGATLRDLLKRRYMHLSAVIRGRKAAHKRTR